MFASKTTLQWHETALYNFSPLSGLGQAVPDRRHGVYIIWHGPRNALVVLRVGQGRIIDRLESHRNDPKIMQHRSQNLRVSWAYFDFWRINNLGNNQLDNIEAFLGQRCAPIYGERFPDAPPHAVNLPWEQHPVYKTTLQSLQSYRNY